ncbi:hypothetical protein AB669_04790 [Pedobacter sp. BMA]|nr:hypothetical protein AB669_04790 [Pedobacter sp. BMA]
MNKSKRVLNVLENMFIWLCLIDSSKMQTLPVQENKMIPRPQNIIPTRNIILLWFGPRKPGVGIIFIRFGIRRFIQRKALFSFRT